MNGTADAAVSDGVCADGRPTSDGGGGGGGGRYGAGGGGTRTVGCTRTEKHAVQASPTRFFCTRVQIGHAHSETPESGVLDFPAAAPREVGAKITVGAVGANDCAMDC